MRTFLAGLSTAALLIGAGSAQAAIVTGTFSGTVTAGYANGNFGYGYSYVHDFEDPSHDALGSDLTGQAITGTFDTTPPSWPVARRPKPFSDVSWGLESA